MANPLLSTQALLNALKPNTTSAAWQAEFEQHGDWDDLVVRAIVFGLAPQLHYRFQQWELSPPKSAYAKLLVTYTAQTQRNSAIYQQLDSVLQALNAEHIQPIALKGIHLAAHYYPEPALRPMNDIDLLFEPDDLPVVGQILENLGYAGKHKSAELGPGVTKHTSTFRRDGTDGHTPNPYLSANADRTIEPHGSLEESWFGLKVDITPGLRARAVSASFGKQSCLVLAPEDLLLHLCVHFCFHLIMGAPSMVQLSDLLIVSQQTELNWAKLVQQAETYRASPYVLAGLSLAHKVLDAPIPSEAMTQLAQNSPSALRQRIEQLGLADVLKRTQQKPLTTISQRIKRGFQDRHETASWAADWRGRWQVWQTAVDIRKTDTGQLLLKRLGLG